MHIYFYKVIIEVFPWKLHEISVKVIAWNLHFLRPALDVRRYLLAMALITNKPSWEEEDVLVGLQNRKWWILELIDRHNFHNENSDTHLDITEVSRLNLLIFEIFFISEICIYK